MYNLYILKYHNGLQQMKEKEVKFWIKLKLITDYNQEE